MAGCGLTLRAKRSYKGAAALPVCRSPPPAPALSRLVAPAGGVHLPALYLSPTAAAAANNNDDDDDDDVPAILHTRRVAHHAVDDMFFFLSNDDMTERLWENQSWHRRRSVALSSG